MSNIYFYPAIFHHEDSGYSVVVPDLPGCMTQGDTLEEALAMAEDAIGLYLEERAPADYPRASEPNDITPSGNSFVMMVQFNKLAYDRKYSTQAVKKTLSIPKWLNTLALEKNINFSNVLQNALRRELGIA